MELDQEKQYQEAAERCRALAQRIVRELAPRSVQVLEDSGLLEKAFCKMNTAVVQSAPELLVVADPQWVTLPAVQAEKVLLVCAEYAGMADCAKQLAAQGFCRELAWKDRGKEQLTALFCRMAAPELPELEDGYEQQLDVLRERTLLAERTAAQQAAQRRAADPVKLVEQRDKKIEPAPVDLRWDLSGAVDAEGLVAHAEDQVGLFPAHALVLVEHRNTVKQVARLDHYRRQEDLHRRKRREQHARRDKFKAAAEDDDAHDHGIPEAEAGDMHVDAIGKPQK